MSISSGLNVVSVLGLNIFTVMGLYSVFRQLDTRSCAQIGSHYPLITLYQARHSIQLIVIRTSRTAKLHNLITRPQAGLCCWATCNNTVDCCERLS